MTEANHLPRTPKSARTPRVSIAQKLVALNVLISGALVPLLTSYFLNQQLHASRGALEQKAAAYGRLASKEVASAIAFDNQAIARETFDSLAQDEDIDGLVLMTSTGRILYAHGSPGPWNEHAKRGVVEQRLFDLGDRPAVVTTLASAEGPRGTLVIEPRRDHRAG